VLPGKVGVFDGVCRAATRLLHGKFGDGICVRKQVSKDAVLTDASVVRVRVYLCTIYVSAKKT